MIATWACDERWQPPDGRLMKYHDEHARKSGPGNPQHQPAARAGSIEPRWRLCRISKVLRASENRISAIWLRRYSEGASQPI
jgi:hypothetical protein